MSVKSRKSRLENGHCALCGVKPHRPNKTTCEECGSFESKRTQNRFEKRDENGICRQCGIKEVVTKRYCEDCRIQRQVHANLQTEKKRILVFNSYGGKCQYCGENDKDVLTLDHVNDDGSEHRKIIGSNLYGWAVKNKFPDSLQILCANCQLRKLRKQMVRRRMHQL